jgi:hypothetical protein
MKFHHTSNKETVRIIKYLKTESYDEISTKVLKTSSSFISSRSIHKCNKLLSLGIFPISQIDIRK